MGANPTQAQALLLFVIGFTLAAAGFSLGGNVILIILGLALAAGSIVIFRKCKPWEQRED
jgi:glucose dehydrogenase